MAHIHPTSELEHEHHYVSGHERAGERRTLAVAGLTAVMMVIEIACGYFFHSMALTADGWHMATHAGAIGIAAFAYVYARKQAGNPRFSFGTGKVNALAGFTSGVVLAVIAILIIAESVSRLTHPLAIAYGEAVPIAFLGLGVNLVSALVLKGDHLHDHNLRAAYVHVLADALTSIIAIGALLAGETLGWRALDPLAGIIGALVIAQWALTLTRRTASELLDETADTELEQLIRATIERDADNKVTDLHLWHIAPGKLSAIISLVTDRPQPPSHYKSLLSDFPHLVHVTVEVNCCRAA